jgi:glycosyltransferase involved in cell wall biosynthesis
VEIVGAMPIATPESAIACLAAEVLTVSRSSVKPKSGGTRQRRDRTPALARLSLGLPELPTIAAAGPFDDESHAQRLAAMFTAVQQNCQAQIMLLGSGKHRSIIERRATEHGLQTRLLIKECNGERRSQLLAAAELVIPNPTSGPAAVIEVMAAGRALVAAANPVTAQLVLPSSAGLLYRPGDGLAMTAAVVRLLTQADLRSQMGSRARQVAVLNTER